MMVFAEQGYVVVAFNPTGSFSFGQAVTDRIQNQWGGLPYQDPVLGWEYIENNLPYVNTSRAMALGASYGGYMMNWVQGNDLGRKFKASSLTMGSSALSRNTHPRNSGSCSTISMTLYGKIGIITHAGIRRIIKINGLPAFDCA
jgi:dipeptidyl aminopeptidase/acylaminoacyl peptidase